MTSNEDCSLWLIGGTTLIGLGVGLVVLKMSALWFVAAILIGIGTGVALTPLLPRR